MFYTLLGVQLLIIAENLIYIQLQKTGCTFVEKVLREIFDVKKIGKHTYLDPDGNVRIISNDRKIGRVSNIKDKLVIGSVRNPWRWYVSLWAFGCQNKGAIKERLTTRRIWPLLGIVKCEVHTWPARLYEPIKPIKTFKPLYEDCQNKQNFGKWLKLLLGSKYDKALWEGYWRSPVNDFAGLMTHRYCKLHIPGFPSAKIDNLQKLKEFDKKHNILDYTIRTENIKTDLKEALRLAGYDKAAKKIDEITSKKINPSKHKDPSYYYTENLNRLVKEKEQFLIDKYNYSPIKQ